MQTTALYGNLAELHVPANLYRAEKLPLYYAGETIELGKGVVLGGLIETKATKMKVRAEETGELLPAEFKAKIVEEDDRILVNGFFEENTIVVDCVFIFPHLHQHFHLILAR